MSLVNIADLSNAKKEKLLDAQHLSNKPRAGQWLVEQVTGHAIFNISWDPRMRANDTHQVAEGSERVNRKNTPSFDGFYVPRWACISDKSVSVTEIEHLSVLAEPIVGNTRYQRASVTSVSDGESTNLIADGFNVYELESPVTFHEGEIIVAFNEDLERWRFGVPVKKGAVNKFFKNVLKDWGVLTDFDKDAEIKTIQKGVAKDAIICSAFEFSTIPDMVTGVRSILRNCWLYTNDDDAIEMALKEAVDDFQTKIERSGMDITEPLLRDIKASIEDVTEKARWTLFQTDVLSDMTFNEIKAKYSEYDSEEKLFEAVRQFQRSSNQAVSQSWDFQELPSFSGDSYQFMFQDGMTESEAKTWVSYAHFIANTPGITIKKKTVSIQAVELDYIEQKLSKAKWNECMTEAQSMQMRMKDDPDKYTPDHVERINWCCTTNLKDDSRTIWRQPRVCLTDPKEIDCPVLHVASSSEHAIRAIEINDQVQRVIEIYGRVPASAPVCRDCDFINFDSSAKITSLKPGETRINLVKPDNWDTIFSGTGVEFEVLNQDKRFASLTQDSLLNTIEVQQKILSLMKNTEFADMNYAVQVAKGDICWDGKKKVWNVPCDIVETHSNVNRGVINRIIFDKLWHDKEGDGNLQDHFYSVSELDQGQLLQRMRDTPKPLTLNRLIKRIPATPQRGQWPDYEKAHNSALTEHLELKDEWISTLNKFLSVTQKGISKDDRDNKYKSVQDMLKRSTFVTDCSCLSTEIEQTEPPGRNNSKSNSNKSQSTQDGSSKSRGRGRGGGGVNQSYPQNYPYGVQQMPGWPMPQFQMYPGYPAGAAPGETGN